MARLLGVSRQGFYAWERRGALVLVVDKPLERQRPAKLHLDLFADVGEQEPLIVAAGLAERRRQALAREHSGEHVVGDRLGVDEHPVAVEDHQLVHRSRSTLRPGNPRKNPDRSLPAHPRSVSTRPEVVAWP